MNDVVFSQELAAVLGSSAFADLASLFLDGDGKTTIHAVQSGEIMYRPSLGITGEWKAYGFARRMGQAVFEIRGRQGAETEDGEQYQRVMGLLEALLGRAGRDEAETAANRAAAIARMTGLLLTRGKVKLLGAYGPTADFLEAGVEGDELVTMVRMHFVWEFAPAL